MHHSTVYSIIHPLLQGKKKDRKKSFGSSKFLAKKQQLHHYLNLKKETKQF